MALEGAHVVGRFKHAAADFYTTENKVSDREKKATK
jgi:hypothetical protein